MKKFLLSVLSSPKGKLITWTGSVLTGAITFAAGRFGFDLAPDTQGWLSGIVTTGLAAAVETWVGYENAKGVQSIQRALQVNSPAVKVDGYAGPVTVQKVRVETRK